MKLILIALIASTAAVFGTTLQVWSGGEFGVTITDNAGAPVGDTAFAAIGTWNGATIESAADLASAFAIGEFTGGTGPVVATEIIPAGFGSGNPGVFNINNILKSSTAAVQGQQIALVVWTGGATLGDATEALVFQYDALYDSAATPTVLVQGTATGTLAFGQSPTQMLAIPEPSSALLLGLGGLGLLIRRKR